MTLKQLIKSMRANISGIESKTFDDVANAFGANTTYGILYEFEQKHINKIEYPTKHSEINKYSKFTKKIYQ